MLYPTVEKEVPKGDLEFSDGRKYFHIHAISFNHHVTAKKAEQILSDIVSIFVNKASKVWRLNDK